MEPDGPEEWHVAPADDGAFQEFGDGDGDDEDPWGDDDEPWWNEAADAGDGTVGGGGAGGGGGGRPARRVLFGGNSPRLTLAVALVALVLGVVAGLAFLRWPSAGAGSANAAGATPGASPSSGPDQNGGGSDGGLPTLSPQQGSGNGTLEVQIVGTVTAVNTRSITIGGQSGSVTAWFSTATKFSGHVRSPAGIKDGDQVAVVATGTPSRLAVASIQDPASAQ